MLFDRVTDQFARVFAVDPAHQDEKARESLDQHLELVARRNLILFRPDRHIVPGSEWDSVIQETPESADIILLLLSLAFMASRFVKEEEIPVVMGEHEARRRIIP